MSSLLTYLEIKGIKGCSNEASCVIRFQLFHLYKNRLVCSTNSSIISRGVTRPLAHKMRHEIFYTVFLRNSQ